MFQRRRERGGLHCLCLGAPTRAFATCTSAFQAAQQPAPNQTERLLLPAAASAGPCSQRPVSLLIHLFSARGRTDQGSSSFAAISCRRSRETVLFHSQLIGTR
jgi:hypothetical protein